MNATIHKVSAVRTEEGAGAKVRRLFPTAHLEYIDPFVLLDEFFLDPLAGFPSHPHRGFEAITYMIEGSFRHKDNLGNNTEVFPLGVQKFNAGKGIVHSEMPGNKGLSHGFQLWVNLPKRLKGKEPSYQQVDADDIPETRDNGIIVRTIVGKGSPVQLHTPVLYQDIKLGQASFTIHIPDDFVSFVYVYQGILLAGETAVNPGEALLLGELKELKVQSQDRAQFLAIAGKPHNEPIYQHGSFVD